MARKRSIYVFSWKIWPASTQFLSRRIFILLNVKKNSSWEHQFSQLHPFASRPDGKIVKIGRCLITWRLPKLFRVIPILSVSSYETDLNTGGGVREFENVERGEFFLKIFSGNLDTWKEFVGISNERSLKDSCWVNSLEFQNWSNIKLLLHFS